MTSVPLGDTAAVTTTARLVLEDSYGVVWKLINTLLSTSDNHEIVKSALDLLGDCVILALATRLELEYQGFLEMLAQKTFIEKELGTGEYIYYFFGLFIDSFIDIFVFVFVFPILFFRFRPYLPFRTQVNRPEADVSAAVSGPASKGLSPDRKINLQQSDGGPAVC